MYGLLKYQAMKILPVLALFLTLGAAAQSGEDTLYYGRGADSLGRFLLKYLARADLSLSTSTFYWATIALDETGQITEISMWVEGDTSSVQTALRAIAATNGKWTGTGRGPWRVYLPINVFLTDERGRHPPPPPIATRWVWFNQQGQPASPPIRTLQLPPIEITIRPPKQ